MADDVLPPEYCEALRRDERTVTCLVIDPDKRVVTVTLGGGIAGTKRRTFVAAISEHPELEHVTLGDEICAPMRLEAAEDDGPNRNSQSSTTIYSLPLSCPMGRCGLQRFPGSRNLAHPRSADTPIVRQNCSPPGAADRHPVDGR
jgi:hypothetical protein